PALRPVRPDQSVCGVGSAVFQAEVCLTERLRSWFGLRVFNVVQHRDDAALVQLRILTTPGGVATIAPTMAITECRFRACLEARATASHIAIAAVRPPGCDIRECLNRTWMAACP